MGMLLSDIMVKVGSVKNLTDGISVFSQNIPFCPI